MSCSSKGVRISDVSANKLWVWASLHTEKKKNQTLFLEAEVYQIFFSEIKV